MRVICSGEQSGVPAERDTTVLCRTAGLAAARHAPPQFRSLHPITSSLVFHSFCGVEPRAGPGYSSRGAHCTAAGYSNSRATEDVGVL